MLFDSVHNFKNVYNNFERSLLLQLNFEENQKEMCANYEHVESIYEEEKEKAVKLAFKLSDKVLHPKSLEKNNVKSTNKKANK